MIVSRIEIDVHKHGPTFGSEKVELFAGKATIYADSVSKPGVRAPRGPHDYGTEIETKPIQITEDEAAELKALLERINARLAAENRTP